MVHRSSVGLVAVGAALMMALSACTSSGVKTQDPPSSASTMSSSSAAPSSTPLSTPTVAPIAQAAVNALISLDNVLAEADRDPQSFDPAAISPYVMASIAKDLQTSYAQMSSSGLAYRGQPDDPNLKVVGFDVNAKPQKLYLTSCPIPNARDPYVQYTVASGAPVTTPTVIFQKAYQMVLDTDGKWKLLSVQSDTATKCAAA